MRRALPLLAALAGCGSTPAAELPPPAAPAAAPPPQMAPAGVVVRLPAPAPALAVDARGRVTAGAVLLDGRAARPRLLGPAPGGAAPPAPDRATGAAGYVAEVDAQARELALRNPRGREIDRVPAGVSPRRLVSDGGRRWYVTDTGGEALLLFERRGEELMLVRRVHLPGSPFALAMEREVAYRVWVALAGRNELVGLPAHGRPHPVERLPTVRRPLAVAADAVTGRVFVAGGRELQAIPPP